MSERYQIQPSKPCGVFLQLMSIGTMLTGLLLCLSFFEGGWGKGLIGIIVFFSGINMLKMGGRPARRNR